METEKVAENSKSRCEEQDIPFYRFNPDLKEIIPAGETDNEKLLDMVIETKIQIKEQGLKEMTELLQMITINSSDASVTCTPSVAQPSTQAASYIEKHSPPPPNVRDHEQFQQVPRLMITSSESGEDEGEEDRTNDHYNDQLNASMVSPVEATVDDSGVVNSGTDFLESESAKEELDNGELPHKHYQLEVDNQDQESHQHQPGHSYLETVV